MKQILSKLSRRRLIELFVRHRYFYNQGNNVLTTLSVIPVEKVAIIAASVKYLFGEHLSPHVIYIAAGGYLVYRVVVRWVIGFIWHREDGYDIETEWNKGKIPPSRVEVINCEEIARACTKSYPEDECLGSVGSCPTCKDAPGSIYKPDPNGVFIKRPDWVHPDDGWRPSPDSGPRGKVGD